MTRRRDDARRGHALAEAERVLAMMRITRPEQIDAARIAQALDVEVEIAELRSAVGQLSAHQAPRETQRRPVDRRGWIRVSPDIRTAARRAFTIAHELGHFVLRHEPAPAGAACTAGALEGRSARAEEQDANAFASALLLPAPMLASWAADERANVASVRALARRFRVAIETAAIRLMELTPHPWAIVICRDGRVARVSRSASFRGYVVRGWVPGPASGVAECVARGRAPRLERTVDAGTWFRDADVTAAPVIEHSMILPRTSDVLTMLRAEPRDRSRK